MKYLRPAIIALLAVAGLPLWLVLSGSSPSAESEANVRVIDVTVTAPDDALVAEEFLVYMGVHLLNDGPEESVLVDTTFTFSSPPSCSALPAGPETYQDVTLPRYIGVYVARVRLVTCSQPGIAAFDADVTVAIDPGESVTDPDPSDNSGTDSDETEILPASVGGIADFPLAGSETRDRPPEGGSPLPLAASVTIGALLLGAGGLYVVKMRRA